MQQDHLSLGDAKNHSRDSVTGKVASNFPKSMAQRPANRHANWPAKLHKRNVGANDSPIVDWQLFQPLTNRFRPMSCSIEDGCDLFQLQPPSFQHRLYHVWYTLCVIQNTRSLTELLTRKITPLRASYHQRRTEQRGRVAG